MVKEITAMNFEKEAYRFSNRLFHKQITMDQALEHIDSDTTSAKQAERMKKTVKQRYEDRLDLLLFRILETLEQPEMLGFSGYEVVTVYPKPVVSDNRDSINVVYEADQNYLFTDNEIYERYVNLCEEIEKAQRDKEEQLAEAKRKEEEEKEEQRLNYVAYHAEEILEEKEQGASYKDLAEKYNVSYSTVIYHVRKYKQQNS